MNTRMETVAARGAGTNNRSVHPRKSIAGGNSPLSKLLLWAVLVLYVYLLVKIILLKFHSLDMGFLWSRLLAGLQQPDLLSQRLESGNLVLFQEISRSLQSFSSHDRYNLIGNVAIFMPLGILLGMMFARNKLAGMKVLLCAFLLSLCLETAQLLFMIGQFDVDDLLLNTIGGMLGFAAYRSAARAIRGTSDKNSI
ncbi:VanZ family protein [Paenibacillus pinisoli]|uniref:VanZ family protein n=1 Tax=Paenibacillus pinisoli TaxID=1276110 RepID=A0A3A6PFY7_9BACL|nr:VanZ family protein [Paenibacillus pinisoli]RJX39947.1 VanZ family protein [Paenibacillus pinisoli]